MNFSAMNETDVRELIVRPLIRRLGYEIGTPHNVRSEVKLTYDQKILGRRKPNTDHRMAGFVDYVCEVIGCGRWIIEVKAPGVDLTVREWEQGHSYAAHPEIAASHFLLTNGRTFQLYSMLEPKTPICDWSHEEQEQHWVNIENVLGPKHIRRRFEVELRNRGKALAPGLGAVAQILGGRVDYTEYESPDFIHPAPKELAGLRATIEGDAVYRDESGLIRAKLKLAGPKQLWDDMNRLAGVDGFEFTTADEYISTDDERPTILQSLTQFDVPTGTPVEGLPGIPPGVKSLPFSFRASAFTQVVAFLEGQFARGLFSIEYQIKFPPEIERHLPKPIAFKSYGDFQLTLG